MKVKGVTIDAIDIDVHRRYAKDQALLDPVFIQEPHLVAPHSEIAGNSSIYSSKWEELFELKKRNTTWAHFTPPERFFSQSNRFFSFYLLKEMLWDEEASFNEEDTKEEETHNILKAQEEASSSASKKPTFQQILQIASYARRELSEPSSFLEQDRTFIISLLESVRKLNTWINHIRCRKAQYQKG